MGSFCHDGTTLNSSDGKSGTRFSLVVELLSSTFGLDGNYLCRLHEKHSF